MPQTLPSLKEFFNVSSPLCHSTLECSGNMLTMKENIVKWNPLYLPQHKPATICDIMNILAGVNI
jgi:hypothetical protein